MVIKQSLIKDIKRLQAKSTQPSPWQLQNLAIQNIQDFLYRHERAVYVDTGASADVSQNNAVKNTETNQSVNNSTLTRKQLTIHEVIMTLNLASQASNMHDREQLITYLNQARKQLQTLVSKQVKQQQINQQKIKQPAVESKITADENNVSTKSSPKNIAEVIEGLDELIANAPKSSLLLTSQILDKPPR